MANGKQFEIVPLTEVLRSQKTIDFVESHSDPSRTANKWPASADPLPAGRSIGGSERSIARIIVVDDERIIADSLAAILQTRGYEAAACYDGESALQACRSAAPDCIISDVVMPGISGIDLAISIRQHYPACRILLFSGQAATLDLMEQARSTGHQFEILSKPVHPTDLLARLESRKPIPPKGRREQGPLWDQLQA